MCVCNIASVETPEKLNADIWDVILNIKLFFYKDSENMYFFLLY